MSHVCICVFVFICMGMHTCMHVRMHACMHGYLQTNRCQSLCSYATYNWYVSRKMCSSHIARMRARVLRSPRSTPTNVYESRSHAKQPKATPNSLANKQLTNQPINKQAIKQTNYPRGSTQNSVFPPPPPLPFSMGVWVCVFLLLHRWYSTTTRGNKIMWTCA